MEKKNCRARTISAKEERRLCEIRRETEKNVIRVGEQRTEINKR